MVSKITAIIISPLKKVFPKTLKLCMEVIIPNKFIPFTGDISIYLFTILNASGR